MTIAPLLRGMASVMQNLWTGLSFFTWAYQPRPGCALWVNNEVMSFLVVSTNHICQFFLKASDPVRAVKTPPLGSEFSPKMTRPRFGRTREPSHTNEHDDHYTTESSETKCTTKPKQVWQLRHCYADGVIYAEFMNRLDFFYLSLPA